MAAIVAAKIYIYILFFLHTKDLSKTELQIAVLSKKKIISFYFSALTNKCAGAAVNIL